MSYDLEFEAAVRPLATELERLQAGQDVPNGRLTELNSAIDARLRHIYANLTPWQKVQVARHRQRPYTLDYVKLIFADFVELHGDRRFGDDAAIVGGPALLDGEAVMLVGHQKGRDTRENLQRSFGMPHPEGYRKAIRLFKQAEKFGMAVVTFIDTPGANPSLPAEERGQSQAIAEAIGAMLTLRVPTVAIITGEGGSGGALAISVADRIVMLEHAIFTVASPEAAASILWRDSARASDAAAAMKITAADLYDLGIVDRIVAEPTGGAHRDHAATARALQGVIVDTLQELNRLDVDSLLEQRREKYRRIGDVSR